MTSNWRRTYFEEPLEYGRRWQYLCAVIAFFVPIYIVIAGLDLIGRHPGSFESLGRAAGVFVGITTSSGTKGGTSTYLQLKERDGQVRKYRIDLMPEQFRALKEREGSTAEIRYQSEWWQNGLAIDIAFGNDIIVQYADVAERYEAEYPRKAFTLLLCCVYVMVVLLTPWLRERWIKSRAP